MPDIQSPGKDLVLESQMTLSNEEASQVIPMNHSNPIDHEEKKVLQYIPDEIINALKPPTDPSNPLAPGNKPKTDGVWFNANRRKRYKYLLDNPPCTCGAGRDISFLYDVAGERTSPLPPIDPDDRSKVRKEALDEKKLEAKKKPFKLPEILMPEEFHLVKSKGVSGIDYSDEKYGAQTADHEKHMTSFPSLKPASRKEVVYLRFLMDQLLETVGVEDEAVEEKGPTQMHNLLTLIKKEQDVYNLIFHEIIRQVSVECVERGELLSHLRNKYQSLLDKVPRHVRSMHAEVMAQRALDRRLTEELMKFKNSIISLAKELEDVREHDKRVSNQAEKARKELKNALMESEKNASLLTEYHDLYELQRQRLENQVSVLSEEKEIWSSAAYSLALKVTENNRLNTAKRVHTAEKSWSKLASHFAIFLSDRDSEVMAQLQSHVDKWREIVMQFDLNIIKADRSLNISMLEMKKAITTLQEDLSKIITSPDRVKQPSKELAQKLYSQIVSFQNTINAEMDRYSGDIQLEFQEQYKALEGEMKAWTEAGMKVFTRHTQDDGSNYPDLDLMHTVNTNLVQLMKQYNIRINGENGVAKYLIMLNNDIEYWELKLQSIIGGKQAILTETEWFKFSTTIKKWPSYLNEVLECYGKNDSLEERAAGKIAEEMTLDTAVKEVQHWASSSTNGIDNEDQRLIDQVGSIHKSMLHWVVQVLLKLAPDRPDNTSDSYAQMYATLEQIVVNGTKLFDKLTNFTNYLISCCTSAVMDPAREAMYDTDADYQELKKVKKECDEWVNTANILIQEVRGDMPVAIGDFHPTDRPDTESSTFTAATHDKSDLIKEKSTDSSQKDQPEPSAPEKLDEQQEQEELFKREGIQMQAICTDQNVRPFDLEAERQKQDSVDTKMLMEKADIGSDQDSRKAFEAIAAMEQLQKQIIDTEQRAQKQEERALKAEEEIQVLLEEIRQMKIKADAEAREADRKKEEAEERAAAEIAKKEEEELKQRASVIMTPESKERRQSGKSQSGHRSSSGSGKKSSRDPSPKVSGRP